MQERTAVEVATLKVARVLQSNHLCPMVPTTKISQIEFVNEGSRLNEVIDLLRHAPRVAVDIESNGFFRYHERVCLVQLASAETAFLVDPLAINDVRPLGELLADRSVEKVFHAADNDLRSLDRDWGFRVNNLFDTSIAAAFVGSERLGLQSVMKEYTGVELAKPRRLQLSDWTKRPLSPEAQKYAADDVLHLLQVREALSERLNELSRLPWTKAEFERMQKVRHTPTDREWAFLSIKGRRDLDRRGLAVLRSVFRFREREASRRDRPPFKVIPDFALLKLSSEPAVDLATVKGLGRFGRRPANRGLKAAIDNGLRSKPITLPQRMRREFTRSLEETDTVKARLRSLKSWRSELGRGLGLDSSLLWPRVSLERLARDPTGLDAELVSPEVRSWQRCEFGTALNRVLETLEPLNRSGRPPRRPRPIASTTTIQVKTLWP